MLKNGIIHILLVVLVIMVIPKTSVWSAEQVNLCQLFEKPSKFAKKVVEINGYLRPMMHGTYLKQEDCDQGILIVLPDEIPNYKETVKVIKDSEYEIFEKARFNYLPGVPKYSAVFMGMIEYKRSGKGFGYYGNHRVRLVLQSITKGVFDQLAQPEE